MFKRFIGPKDKADDKGGLSVGDSVRFKPGVKDVDFDLDIGGWQGRVVSQVAEFDVVMVAFDSIALRAMPGEYLERCEEEGLDWSEYGAEPDDLEVAPLRDTPADVKEAIAELSARYAYSYLGEDGRKMNAILAGVDPEDEMAALHRWGDYLGQTLSFPLKHVVELITDRGPIRFGDRLRVLGINTVVDDHYGLLADVRRGRKSYVHPFCDLEASGKKSPNRDPLWLYRLWFANH